MQTLLAPHVFPYLATVVGLVLGSFYNVCVHRYLTGESIVFPGSKCPKCGHPLSWWENIPLLSYMMLRGKCRSCKAPISLRYPLVELVSGLWALGLALKFGASAAWCVYMVLGAIFIIASFIDFASYLLPDILTLPGAVLALAGAYFFLHIPLKDSLIGAAVGAGVFWLLQWGFKLLKGYDGLGTGDIKLMLLIGALLGWKGLPVAILAGALCALLASTYYAMKPKKEGERTMVPFGPFLSLGAMLYILFGQYYWKYFVS